MIRLKRHFVPLLLLSALACADATGPEGSGTPPKGDAGSGPSGFRTVILEGIEGVAMNDRTEVVGMAPGGPAVWKQGKVEMLRLPDGTVPDFVPVDVNNRGQIAGYRLDADGMPQGVLWDGGQLIDLGTVVGNLGERPEAINDRGIVVGRAVGGQDPNLPPVKGFLWKDGAIRGFPISLALYDVNERGDAPIDDSRFDGASVIFKADSERPVDQILDFNDIQYSAIVPLAINNRRQIVGTGYVVRGPGEDGAGFTAWLWYDGEKQLLGPVDEFTSFEYRSEANEINDRGEAIGYTTVLEEGEFREVPVLWRPPDYDQVRLPSEGVAWDINNRGVIGVGDRLLFPRSRTAGLAPAPVDRSDNGGLRRGPKLTSRR